MKKNYDVTGAERKKLVQVIASFTGELAKYMKVPTCAYVIGNLTVTKDGALESEEPIDPELLTAITAAGFSAETDGMPEVEGQREEEITEAIHPEEEPTLLTVSVPLSNHTGSTIRNLINLIYTRAGLLNKALGTTFRVDEALVEKLEEAEGVLTLDSIKKLIIDFESENGSALNGLIMGDETLTFTALPETADTERLRTFTIICGMMNKQALSQKRIQAKTIMESNEKYALRIWLTRMGMNGPEYKEARRVLMANLSGHCAFHTPAEEERWKARQAAKKEAKAKTVLADSAEETEGVREA